MNQDTQCSECWSPLNLRTEILISRGMLSGCRILGKWLGHEDQIVTTGSRHLKGVSSRDPKPNKTNDTKSYFQRNHPSLTPQSYFCKVLCSQGLKNLNPRSCARISLCGPSPGLESGLQPPPPPGCSCTQAVFQFWDLVAGSVPQVHQPQPLQQNFVWTPRLSWISFGALHTLCSLSGHCHMGVTKSHSMYLPEQWTGSTWDLWVIAGWREVLSLVNYWDGRGQHDLGEA